MKKVNQISAIFNIKLHNHIMVMWPKDNPINYTIKIGNKQIDLTLEKCFSNKFMDEGDKYYTEPIYDINIKVTKKGIFKIPEVEIKNKTTKDYTKRINYFDKLLPSFSKPAHEVYTRLIYFLKYLLYNPYLIEFPKDHVFFHNAKWIDADGKEIGNNTYKLPLVDAYELEMKLGKNIPIQKFSPEVSELLEIILNSSMQPQLHSQMLVGAVSSLFDFNLHRAVVESAIACEIMVKRAFFPKDTPSGSAFDYLEDKSRLKVRVPELIDKVAQEAFGSSYKTDYPNNYKNIENLFRCRNKVVHKGSLEYRDCYTDKIKTAKINTVSVWISSVRYLELWLFKSQNQINVV